MKSESTWQNLTSKSHLITQIFISIFYRFYIFIFSNLTLSLNFQIIFQTIYPSIIHPFPLSFTYQSFLTPFITAISRELEDKIHEQHDQDSSQTAQKLEIDFSKLKVSSGLPPAPRIPMAAAGILENKPVSTFDLNTLDDNKNFMSDSSQGADGSTAQIFYGKQELIEHLEKQGLISKNADRQQLQSTLNIYNSLNPYAFHEPTKEFEKEIHILYEMMYQLSDKKVAEQLEKILAHHKGDSSEQTVIKTLKQKLDSIEHTVIFELTEIMERSFDLVAKEMQTELIDILLFKRFRKIDYENPKEMNHLRNKDTRILTISKSIKFLQDYINENNQIHHQHKIFIQRSIYRQQVFMQNLSQKKSVLSHLDTYDLTTFLKSLPKIPDPELPLQDTIQSITLNLILDKYIEQRAQKSITDMFFLAEVCQHQYGNKELQNKFQHALSVMDFQDINIKNLTKLMECLFGDRLKHEDDESVGVFEQGRFDKQLYFGRFLIDFPFTTISVYSKQDFKDILDFFDLMERYCPKALQEIKISQVLGVFAQQLDMNEYLDLEDQIRLSNKFIDKTCKPDFFFKEILENEHQNFVDHVRPQILAKFIDNIVFRAETFQRQFEHQAFLLRDQSKNIIGVTELTVRMLRSVVTQFLDKLKNSQNKGAASRGDLQMLESKQKQGLDVLSKVFSDLQIVESKQIHEFDILSKVFRSETITKIFFKNSAEVRTILEAFIIYYTDFISANSSTTSPHLMTVSSWKDFYSTMNNFSELVEVHNDQAMKDSFKNLYGISMKALDQQIIATTNKLPKKYHFDIADLFQLNEKIIDLKTKNGPLFAEEYYKNKQYAHKISSNVFKQFIIRGLVDKKEERGMSGGDHAINIMSQKLPMMLPKLNFLQDIDVQNFYRQMILSTNSSLIYKESGPLLSMALELLNVFEKYGDNNVPKNEVFLPFWKIIDFLQDIPNIRSIHGRNLNKLFYLINRLTEDRQGVEADEEFSDSQATSNIILERALKNRARRQQIIQSCRRVLLLAATNLQTLELELYQDYSENMKELRVETPENGMIDVLKDLNIKIKDQEKKDKVNVLDMYTELYKGNIEKFDDEMAFGTYNLAPLSTFLASMVGLPDGSSGSQQKLSHHEVHTSLKILRQYNIHQIDRTFLTKLSQRYTDMGQINELRNYGISYFLDFVEDWPKYLKNELFIGVILESQGTFTVKQQSQAIAILAKKNVLDPKLLKNHFETFTKMTDKSSVKPILSKFIKSCAYLGHTEAYDLRVLVKIFRRIFKQPQECKDDINTLIDLILLIALENYPYSQLFDSKSKEFIDNSLDYIDEHFAGTDIVEVQQPADTFDPSKKDQLKAYKLRYIHGIQTDLKTFNKQIRSVKKHEFDAQSIFTEYAPSQQAQELPEGEILDFVMLDSEATDEDEIDKGSQEEQQDKNMVQKDRNEQKSTNREAKEYDQRIQESMASRINEDLAYQHSRQKLINQLGRKEAHIYMFVNFDAMNQQDINSNQQVKVWAILYHFRNKNVDSQIFEEFNTVVHRNCENKAKQHKLFQRFKYELNKQAYYSDHTVDEFKKCPISGWPVDLVIKKNNKLQNNYFFLQEEMCYNVKENREQPLALQQLMMKHVEAAQLGPIKEKTKKDNNKIKETKYQRLQPRYISEKELIQIYLRDHDLSTEEMDSQSDFGMDQYYRSTSGRYMDDKRTNYLVERTLDIDDGPGMGGFGDAVSQNKRLEQTLDF